MAVGLSFCAVLWGLWYLNHRGFSHKWRQSLISEVEKRGVYLTINRLTLNPLQGLVAKGVQIRASREEGPALATINEVVLDINYSNLVHGGDFLNAVELRRAKLSLPLGPPENGRLEISKINARVLLPPHQLNIENAEGLIRGMRVKANGRFINPEKMRWTKRAATPEGEDPLNRLHTALETLENLKLSGGSPELNLRFSGDLAHYPGNLFVEAIFHTGNFSVDGSYRVDSVRIAATLADGLARLDQCTIKDSLGTLDASGLFQLDTGELNLRLRSSLDLPGLIHAVRPGSSLDEPVFYSAPKLELNASARLFHPPSPGHNPRELKLAGRLSTGRFAVRSLMFESAAADFSWDGDRWYLHDARIQHKDGAFVLNAMQVPGDFRFNLDSRIDPRVFLPLLPVEAREGLQQWDFQVPPLLHLEGNGTKAALEAVEVKGHAQLGPTRARGVELKAVSVDLSCKGNVLTCENIKFERPEGIATGTVIYDFNTDELEFQNVRGGLNAQEVVSIFDRDLSLNLAPYRFKYRPSLIVNGKVGCRRGDWKRNHFRVEIEGASGMDYTFLGKDLNSTKISGTVMVVGDRLKLSHLDAKLFGGHLRGHADISLRKDQGDYTAEIFTEDVDFPSLTKLYFDYDTSKGKLNGSFAFSGLHDYVRDIDGKGQLVITDGNVFAIPIFGPFSGILNEVIPGTGYNDARKGTCTFAMKNGIVSTKDLLMEGRGFSILGEGKLFVDQDRMDFTARINAQGFVGKVLHPVSRLLEYVSDGSLSKPTWRPKRLPKVIFGPRKEPAPAPVAEPKEQRNGH